MHRLLKRGYWWYAVRSLTLQRHCQTKGLEECLTSWERNRLLRVLADTEKQLAHARGEYNATFPPGIRRTLEKV
jgi:hypothetical protein